MQISNEISGAGSYIHMAHCGISLLTTLLAPFNDSAFVHDCDRLTFALEFNSLLLIDWCRQLTSALVVLFGFNFRRGSHHAELID